MTEETQQTTDSPAAKQQLVQSGANTTTEVSKVKEKKEKSRPMTKVVVRRLPPTMTQEQFLEQVSPLPVYDYFYFAKADMSLGQHAFSRAYVDFVNQQDIFEFREKFDNYVFVDGKGLEFPAVVEFAPFQRVPKKRIGKKKDPKCGTIESDPYYINFLESLKNQEADVTNSQPKTEYSFQPSDHTPKKVTTTPLLDFLKQRKQEKQRLRDEKREEKRRRDMERKKTKDEPLVSKVLKNMEDKEREKDRETNREIRDEKDRPFQKELKNRNKKEEKYKDKSMRDRDAKPLGKNYRDRDERAKERETKHNKKQEDRKFHHKTDDHGSYAKDDRNNEKEDNYKERKLEEKRGKSYEKMRQEKKRLVEGQKKQYSEIPSDEPNDYYYNTDGPKVESTEDNYTKGTKEANDDNNRPKYKIKKNPDNLRNSGKTDTADQSNEASRAFKPRSNSSTEEPNSKSKSLVDCDGLDTNQQVAKSSHLEDGRGNEEKKNYIKSRLTKRRSSLESGGDSGTGSKSGSGSKTSDRRNASDCESDSSCLRRHKSLDGGNDNNFQKNESEDKEDKDKKDPRLERRIRNKDRPAMEIYRPGMGKFSKQRLEREKGNEERSTPSQSPTPTSGGSNTYKSGKSSSSEVRSMTFKRSVSRDVS
ncbi:regulator of nonsense transcripts 3A [Copidosoma floridanum]|uniref:regulator of nonsense transcripts 3A n=1 Tax=Copidosoma floridanum TaxID=29053 RepID=UPI0006C970F1|nr:regulator of nonsense transcripts 3A [Copidosoma floridanum]